MSALPPAAAITLVASRAPASNRIAIDPDGNWCLPETSTRVLKIAGADAAKTGTVTVTPTVTLHARTREVNAAFQAIIVH